MVLNPSNMKNYGKSKTFIDLLSVYNSGAFKSYIQNVCATKFTYVQFAIINFVQQTFEDLIKICRPRYIKFH